MTFVLGNEIAVLTHWSLDKSSYFEATRFVGNTWILNCMNFFKDRLLNYMLLSIELAVSYH